jgi:hypothetical protein
MLHGLFLDQISLSENSHSLQSQYSTTSQILTKFSQLWIL